LAAPPAGGAARHQRGAKNALAAADGGMWGWTRQQRPTQSRSSMPRAAKPRFQGSICSTRAGSGVSLRRRSVSTAWDGNDGGEP